MAETGDAVQTDEDFEATVRLLQLSDEMEERDKIQNVKKMFPGIQEDVIALFAGMPLESMIEQLRQIAPQVQPHAGDYGFLVDEAPLRSRVVMLDDDDHVPVVAYQLNDNNRPTTSRTTPKHQRQFTNLDQPFDIDEDAWNRDQLTEALWSELQRRSAFTRTKEIKRSESEIIAVKTFLRDHFFEIRQPAINRLVVELDFYTCILVMKLAILGREQKLCEWAYVDKRVMPMLNSAEKIKDRKAEAALVTSSLPPLMTQMWNNYMEIVDSDFSQPLASLRFDCPVCYETFHERDAIFCSPLIGDHDKSMDSYHRFCRECVKSQAIATATDMEIGKAGTGVKCMEPQCKRVILWSRVRPLLSDRENLLLEKRIDNEAVDAVGMKDLEKCQSCSFSMAIEISKEDMEVFKCQACGHEHCRLCDRPYDDKHRGRKCGQFEKDQEDARKQLEEEMTSSVLRKCKGCGVSFERIDGCSKMTCITCKRTQCYVCRADQIDYNHFGEVADGKCPLWSSNADVHRKDELRRLERLNASNGNELITDEVRQKLK